MGGAFCLLYFTAHLRNFQSGSLNLILITVSGKNLQKMTSSSENWELNNVLLLCCYGYIYNADPFILEPRLWGVGCEQVCYLYMWPFTWLFITNRAQQIQHRNHQKNLWVSSQRRKPIQMKVIVRVRNRATANHRAKTLRTFSSTKRFDLYFYDFFASLTMIRLQLKSINLVLYFDVWTWSFP